MLLLPCIALLPALGYLAHAVWRWRSLRMPTRAAAGRVTLIMPLTGRAPGLEALLAALAAQTLPPRRLLVVVESEADPAYVRAAALVPYAAFPVELVIAGSVRWRGQKCSNLIAGLRRIDAQDDAVVLMDGDIRPQPWWLSAAASPALAGTHDVITGFRWQLLAGRGLVGHLVAWVDRMGAVLILPPSLGMVWGGTVGLSRTALATLDLPRLLDRALIDDLTIGAAARRHGLRLLSRSALTVPTPVEGGAAQQCAFLRRQLQSARLCQPAVWAVLMLLTHLAVAGWLAALLALPDRRALGLLLALSGAGLARAFVNAAIGRRIGAPDTPQGLAVQALIGALPPLAEGLPALLGWTMLRPRRMRWRHVEYAVRGPEDVRVVARFPHVH